MAKHQSKIEKLVAELCPKGVQSFGVGEVCDISRGRVMSKDYLKANEGEYPVYSSQTSNDGIFGRINTFDYDGEYVTWTTDGANAGSVFYRKGKFSITNVCGLLKPKKNDLNIKFLSYILGTRAKSYVNAGMGNPKLMSNVMATIEIPIPPLAVQEEIVKILNSFTELEAELEARNKQYEHYRSELLTLNERVRWVTLAEIAMIKHGKDYKKLGKGSIPVYGSGGIMTYVDKSSYDKPTVLIPRKGTITNLFYVDTPFWNVDTIYYTEIDSQQILPKFFYYYMKTIDLGLLDTGSGRPSLTMQILNKIKIPVPSIQEQIRVVSVLDKFNALVSDISIGLPAELSARRSQYEYYRGKLLTFNEYVN